MAHISLVPLKGQIMTIIAHLAGIYIYRLDAEAKEYLKTYIKPEGDSPRVL